MQVNVDVMEHQTFAVPQPKNMVNVLNEYEK